MAGGYPKRQQPIPVKVESRASRILQGRADPLPSAHEIGAGRFSERILDAVDKCLCLLESDRFRDCGESLEALQPTDLSFPQSSEWIAETGGSPSSYSRPGPATADSTRLQRTQTNVSTAGVPDTTRQHDRTSVASLPAIIWLAPATLLVLAPGAWPRLYFQVLCVVVVVRVARLGLVFRLHPDRRT